jgi:hypothetical protein
MLPRSWSDWQSHRQAERRQTRARFRPALESLEDRTVPTLFGPPSPVATGAGPSLVAVGDFNEDGHPDFAVVQRPSTTTPGVVSILLNDGTGSGFHASPGGTVGMSPDAVVTADFNRDGHLDLAITNNLSNSVSILLGDGHGAFHPAPGGPFSSGGQGPTHLAAADFNRDGKLDLAVVDHETGITAILNGAGDGSFSVSDTSLGFFSNPVAIVAADFNGDGRPDLAVSNADPINTVQVSLQDSQGFSQVSPLPLTFGDPKDVAVADVDGDGKLDLVTANSFDNTISVLLGTGAGTFPKATSYPAGLSPFRLALGDFNGDGKPDVAALDSIGMAVLLGSGSGSFTAAAGSPFAGTTTLANLAAGDFNNDGALDLVGTNFTHAQALAFLNHSGTLVSLATSDPAAGFSEPVTFTATVRPTVAGSGTPTGSVTFYDGATPLGSVALDPSGQARFTNTALAVGNHRLTAVYSGDSNFIPRASASLPESVDATGDVTAEVKVTLGRWRRTPFGGRQKVTLQNLSNQFLHGPLWLMLGGLGRRAGLRHRAGLSRSHAPLHSPFVAVPLPGSVLSPGASVTVLLRFASTFKVRYRPSVLAGSGIL